jgi:hypothetical protein
LVWLEFPQDLDIWVRRAECFDHVAAKYNCVTNSGAPGTDCKRSEFSKTSVRDAEYATCGVSKPSIAGPGGAEATAMSGGVTRLDANERPISKGPFKNQFSKWVTWISRHATKMQGVGADSTTRSRWTSDNHIMLDVDQRFGFGPETVSFINAPPGHYQIVVDKYPQVNSVALKEGQPTVQLYFGANGASFECKIDPACSHDKTAVWNVANIRITDQGVHPRSLNIRKYRIRILDSKADGIRTLRRVEIPTMESSQSRSCGFFCSERYFAPAGKEYDDDYLKDVCYGVCKRQRNTPHAYDTCLDLGPEKPKWHLARAGAKKCDSGRPANQNECQAAVEQVAGTHGATPGRTLQVGSGGNCGDGGWGPVPPGCSAQSGGDWAAHWKTSGVNCPSNAYRLVCSGQARCPSECYASQAGANAAGETDCVDTMCVSGNGWLSVQDGWPLSECGSLDCALRCNKQGALMNHAYGTGRGDGQRRTCFRIKAALQATEAVQLEYS